MAKSSFLRDGKIEADDAKTENAHFRKRNLNFFTPITEISLQTEFNFFNYVPSVSKKLYTPFLFAGLGVVAFNPKGRYNNQEYDCFFPLISINGVTLSGCLQKKREVGENPTRSRHCNRRVAFYGGTGRQSLSWRGEGLESDVDP